MLKGFLRLCTLSLAFAFLISGSANSAPFNPEAATCVPNRTPGPIVSTATNSVHVVVNGISYAIPENYFWYSVIGCGAEELSFGLRAFLPDFFGATAATAAEFKRGLGRTVGIQLRSVQTPNLEGFIRIFTDQIGTAPPRYPITWDGVENYGLEHGAYRVIFGAGRSIGDTDVYAERKDSRIANLIRCQGIVCVNFLFYSNAQLEITFERKHLPNWRAIQSGVVNLLDRFQSDGTALSARAAAYSKETVNCVPFTPPAGVGYVQPPVSSATEPVDVVINGVRYNIPRNYFGVPKRCGEQTTNVRLLAFLPNLSGATEQTLAELQQRQPNARRVGIFLRSDRLARDLDGLAESMLLRSKNGVPLQAITWDGVEAYGLEHGVHHGPTVRDVYVERKDGRISAFIECDIASKQDSMPSCTNYVLRPNSQVQIEFYREQLSNWRTLQRDVVNLLDGFASTGVK